MRVGGGSPLPATELLDVPVAGGTLRVARFPGDGPLVLGLHGITASWVSLAPVARALGAGFLVAAPDLRGRGASAHLPGPYGLRAHAEDCARVLEHLDAGPAIVVGESMGGFVAVVLAADHPGLVERLVLVDGGLPLSLPEGADPLAVSEALLGPALSRLSQTYPTRRDYLHFWRLHPALRGAWNADIEAYLDYDLVGTPPRLHSRVSVEAVRADIASGLLEPTLLTGALESLTCPATLLRAPRGLLDQPEPTIPEASVAHWQQRLPQLLEQTVPGTNHYTLMFSEPGVSAIVAAVGAAPARPVGPGELSTRSSAGGAVTPATR